MRRALRFLPIALLFAVALVSRAQGGTPATAVAPPPAYLADPKFQDALKEAKRLEKAKQTAFAYDGYKKANKIAGGQCTECLYGMYATSLGTGSYKDSIAAANTLVPMATTPSAKATAQYMLGRALWMQGGEKPKPAQLEAADVALKASIASYPKGGAAHYLDGQVLARMGKIDEAKAEFTKCVSCASPKDPSRLRAEHFAENPLLSLHKMAPAFVVTALDGSRFNLDAMGGRVVLIDFWATWCGPCNAELPHMKKIAKEFAGQPLVIISVSWDRDETAWKDFLAKNEMTWVQYRDADHKLSDSFGIESIPHYFTIDSDGVLTAEMLGSGSDVEGKLKKLVAKARQAQEQMQAPVAAAGN